MATNTRRVQVQIPLAVIGLLALVPVTSARTVIVNGALLGPEALAQLEQAHCSRIPDGDYFLVQAPNGAWVWGYAAMPGIAQGYIGESCRTAGTSGSSGGASVSEPGWSDEYSRTYGGGIDAGDGTVETFDGASGGYTYE